MQTADSDKNSPRNDEESINFRPSPNFKHMKKYFRAKFEENQCASNGAADSPSYCHDEREKVNKASQEVPKNPPLPKNPPPPDTPPIKQEIEDDEYEKGSAENTEFNQNEGLTPAMIKTDKSETTEKVMCRNFVRGTCKKEGSCIFAHELILSQLQGVYTFCRNFQNSVCNLSKCKFVHATVFEKEHFYRTGYLPPHTLRHLKEGNVQPPPPRSQENTPNVVPQAFPSVQPPPPSAPQPSHGAGPIINPTIVEISTPLPGPPVIEPLFTDDVLISRTSPKREWSEVDIDFSGSPTEADPSESLAKKCKHCDSTEFRYYFTKNKAQKLKTTIQEIALKTQGLDNKIARLYVLLFNLCRLGKTYGGHVYMSPEKKQAILEELRIFGRSYISSRYIDKDKNSELSRISSLVKSLINTGDDLPDIN